MWTLSGTTCKIMIQRYQSENEPDGVRKRLVQEMIRLYRDNKPKQSETELKLGAITFKGQRIEVKIAGSFLRQDAFSFKSGEDTIVLMLQDSPNDDGASSVDRACGEKMLRESIKFPARK